MAMSYTTLTGAKGTNGSLLNWVGYSRIDVGTVVDEAQALLYQYLRVRQMQAVFNFTMVVGAAWVALPGDFLDPIGDLVAPSVNMRFAHQGQTVIQGRRSYAETSGTLGLNPLTTTLGSTQVSVSLASHGFNQGGLLYVTGATAVGGITPNGTFEIVAITDANNFVIDTRTMTATSSAAGGGSAVAYACDNLTKGAPSSWGVWDERIQFDAAFTQQYLCSLMYFQSPVLLSSANQTNFITVRYPNLLRTACQAAAADYMKDDGEYQKGLQRLQMLIDRITQQDDLMLRGAEIYTETP